MNKIALTILSVLVSFSAYCHNSSQSYKFRLYLKDKGHTEYNISNPEKFLSPQSIERKQRQGVSIDQSDIPISNDYFHLISLSGGKVVSHSKWFSTVVIELSDSAMIDNFLNLSFVDSAKYVWKGAEGRELKLERPRLSAVDFSVDINAYDFGNSDAQFKLHNAEDLYESTFSGRGMNIAVIDAGFTNVDVIPHFEGANIKEFKSFVPYGNPLVDSDHGTRVLSTMYGLIPGMLRGSANSANFYLLQSEEVATEFPVEEDYWVRAVEYADSVGVDVINSSLGYNTFDDSKLNYTHDLLDGRTSIMSQAADLAFDKGMIVVTSAGNEGNKEWQKISVPGDAAKALTVGAVDSSGEIAGFSSKGFTADNRLKPDVVSVGRSTVTIGQRGSVGPANGTSFSSPFMAGMIATLWSINPNLNRGALLDIVKQSGDRYQNPDSVFGNGVSDIKVAMVKVLESLPVSDRVYDDGVVRIERSDDLNFNLSLLEATFESKVYMATMLDDKGDILSQQIMMDDNYTFMISDVLGRQSECIYFIVTGPEMQRTVRFNL